MNTLLDGEITVQPEYDKAFKMAGKEAKRLAAEEIAELEAEIQKVYEQYFTAKFKVIYKDLLAKRQAKAAKA